MYGFILAGLSSILIDEPAYLDPGSGSYLLQLLMAALLGSIFVIRASWSRIVGFFKRDEDSSPAPNEEDPPTDGE